MLLAVSTLKCNWFNNYFDIISNKAHVIKAFGISALCKCKYFTIMGTGLLNKFNKTISLFSYTFIPFKIPLAHNIGALI